MCCVIKHADGRYVVSQRRVRMRVTVHVSTELNQVVVYKVMTEEGIFVREQMLILIGRTYLDALRKYTTINWLM